ncbi:MAG: L,D-transpeptidase, partial [Sphingobacteriaceae bacterium]|nr:L,D-transpeptidase [Sphingobacteriaceae bacterium]
MKKTLLFLLLCLFLSSCGWFNTKPEIATVLSEHFDNKLYENFDTVAYALIFSQKMDELSNK